MGSLSAHAGCLGIPSGDFWRLGGIFGAIFLAALLVIGVPYLLATQ